MEDIIRSIREDHKSVCNSIWNNFCVKSSPSPLKASVKVISTNGIRCNRNVSRVNVAQDTSYAAFQNYCNPHPDNTDWALDKITGSGDFIPQSDHLGNEKSSNQIKNSNNEFASKSHVKHFVPNSQTIPPRIEKERQNSFEDIDDGAEQNLHTYDSHDPETLIEDNSDGEELNEIVQYEAEQEALYSNAEKQINVPPKPRHPQPGTVSSDRKKENGVKFCEKPPKPIPKTNKDNDADAAMITLNKITQLQEKILLTILDLRVTIEEAQIVDDPLEIVKRRKRGLEFSIRFARNHLYQIGRLTQDVQRSMTTGDLLQRTLALHNGLVQGIQTYQKAIGSFIMNKNPEKLIVLLDLIANALTMCVEKNVFDPNDSVNEVSVNEDLVKACIEMVQFLKEEDDRAHNVQTFVFKKENDKKSQKNVVKNTKKEKASNIYSIYRAQKPVKRNKNKNGKVAIETNLKENCKSEKKLNNYEEKAKPVDGKHSPSSTKQFKASIETEVEQQVDSDQESHNAYDKLIDDEMNRLKKENQKLTSPEFKEVMMDILRAITKQQLQEVFCPILSEVGSILREKDSQNSKVLIDKILNRLNDLPASDCRRSAVVAGLKKSGTELHDFKTSFNCNDHEKSSSKYQEQGLSGGGANNAANSNFNVRAPSLNENINGGNDTINRDDGVDAGKRSKSSDNFTRVSGDKIVAAVRHEKRKFGDQNKNTLLVNIKDNSSPVTHRNKSTINIATDHNGQIINKKSKDDYFRKRKDELKTEIVRDRFAFLEKTLDHPMYENESIKEPWKAVGRIADKIANELMEEVNFDFEDKNFIKDFLKKEMQTYQ